MYLRITKVWHKSCRPCDLKIYRPVYCTIRLYSGKDMKHAPLSISGFGGLVVSMLASGTQDHGFKPGQSRRIFGRKNPQCTFLQRGSKAVCPMSQIWGMLKTPENYVEVGFSGEICRPFLAHFRSSLPDGSHVTWRGTPLWSTGGTKGSAPRAC